MSYKNCPICTATMENCTCEKPFSLNAIPQHQLDGIARGIFTQIVTFFQDPANQAKYEVWLEERKRNSQGATV